MRKARTFKIAALALTAGILIIMGVGVLAVYRGEVRLPALPLSLAELGIRADKVRYTHTDGNGGRWNLEAESAVYDRARQKAFLDRVQATFYRHDEEVLHLTADKGELQADQKTMTLRGNVVARSSPDTILRTESLMYQGETGTVTTADPVEIEKTKMRVTGVGMTLDLASQRMEVHHSIQSWMQGT